VADDRENELARREILVAYLEVLDRVGELVDICLAVEGDAQQLRRAVQEAFGVSQIAADAVLALQVRRFTPDERQKIKDELVGLDLWLARNSRA
jgi:DNA gyrase/topoisomerase IV subunit A